MISKYKSLLTQNRVPDKSQHYYLKWLRFYLDFCHKYHHDQSSPQNLPEFIKKLKEKKQTEAS